MSAVIRLHTVLREAVAAPQRHLVTRPTGRAVRHLVLGVLHAVPGDEAALDFSEVGVVDASCADEVVARLLIEGDRLPVRRLVLQGLTEDHADPIELALERHGLAVVALFDDGGAPRLLGAAEDDWRTVFTALLGLGRTAVAPVADALAWSAERAEAALDALAASRCVLVHPDRTFELGVVA